MKQKLARYNNAFARRAQKAVDQWAAAYWHNNPFGPEPRADKATYEALWRAEKDAIYAESDAFEKECGFAVDKAWLDDLALHTQIVIKDSPLCYQHGRILYAALRRYIAQAGKNNLTILETGTARGFSATVMARALADAGVAGHLVTFDLLPHDRAMFWNCIDDLQGPRTRRQLLAPWRDLLEPVVTFVEADSRMGLQKVAPGRVDFAFLDGAHTYHDVTKEFEAIVARQKTGDTIMFDDYSPTIFPGLVKAVDDGCARLGYDKTVIRSRGDRAYVIARKQ
jgi:predicted O-methyltransferase YrrM